MILTEYQAKTILSCASVHVTESAGLLRDMISADALTGLQLMLVRGLLGQVRELLADIARPDTLYYLVSSPPPASAPAPCEADE